MVELKKKDIESANKRSLRRYIRNAYEASTDNEEEGTGLKKAYVIQLLIGINVKMKMQTKMKVLLQKPMLVMQMNSKILILQINFYCESCVC